MKLLETIRATAGTLCLAFLALLTGSGWALAAGYVPSAAEAFDSVLYWRQVDGLGALLRGLHYHLSSALVVAGFVFLLATFLADRHRQSVPSRGETKGNEAWTWWLGLTLFLLVLGWCFTGYLLPMDQNAYWGTVVRLGIVETSPGVGTTVADGMRGGALLNAATLPRFYTLHVSILPMIGALLLAMVLRLQWPVLPRRPAFRWPASGGTTPWFAVALAGLAAAYLVAMRYPAPLELPADPTDSEYVPRPEWYFLWLFQFGKYVESVPWVRSLLLPAAGLGLLYALPLLRRQSLRFRASLAAGWCAAWIGLTALAVREDRELPPKLMYEEAMRVQAAENYQSHCYDCHDDDGRGRGPQTRAFDLDVSDLTLDQTWLESSKDEMRAAIRDGKGDMPAFGRKLTPAQIDALIEYSESAFRGQSQPPQVEPTEGN